MTETRESLQAGAPVCLPSGQAVLVVERTRLTVFCLGGWRGVIARREPHALLLRAADGGVTVLAAGPAPVSMAELDGALPGWGLWPSPPGPGHALPPAFVQPAPAGSGRGRVGGPIDASNGFRPPR